MADLLMGYWDCPVCGKKEIRGDVTNCPACGRARGDVKFYLKGYTEGQELSQSDLGAFEHLSEQQAQEIGSNPDWYCSFCNSLNNDNAQFCSNCGASRADSEANYFDRLKKKQEEEQRELDAQPRPQPAAKKSPPKVLFAILAVLVIALAFWLWPRSKAGTVRSFGWTQSIQTENYREVTEEDWSVPPGGSLVSQRQKVHHYDQVRTGTRSVTRTREVLDHYETYYTAEDNGNGTFRQVSHSRPVYKTETYTEQEPVYESVPRYQTAYTYTIWRWKPGDPIVTSGQDHSPVWGELPKDEKVREKQDGRSGRYTFTTENEKGEPTVYELCESDWQKNKSVWEALQEGQKITIRTSGGSSTLQDENKKNLARIREVR